MSIKKCVITKGIYNDKELRLLVSFDEDDKPIDLINLDITKIGIHCEATVEKVLSDIDACILKLSTGDKGFIEIKKLSPENYLERCSLKKKVCQGDRFYVKITQDKKNTKPYSCSFLKIEDYKNDNTSYINYYIETYCDEAVQIITDLEEYKSPNLNIRFYNDDSLSLWNLYSFNSILDKATSKIVHLKSGANLLIEKTEAMTIVDVNSSKNYGKTDFYKINEEAIVELIRQLRLRAISGIILVDLLKVSTEEQNALINEIKKASKNDISQINVHGFSNLGLLELTRSRNLAPFTI